MAIAAGPVLLSVAILAVALWGIYLVVPVAVREGIEDAWKRRDERERLRKP